MPHLPQIRWSGNRGIEGLEVGKAQKVFDIAGDAPDDTSKSDTSEKSGPPNAGRDIAVQVAAAVIGTAIMGVAGLVWQTWG